MRVVQVQSQIFVLEQRRRSGSHGWYKGNATDAGKSTRIPSAEASIIAGAYTCMAMCWSGVFDCMTQNYYAPKVHKNNPTGPETGSERVARGGAWYFGQHTCRSAKRLGMEPDSGMPGNMIGFRVVLDETKNEVFDRVFAQNATDSVHSSAPLESVSPKKTSEEQKLNPEQTVLKKICSLFYSDSYETFGCGCLSIIWLFVTLGFVFRQLGAEWWVLTAALAAYAFARPLLLRLAYTADDFNIRHSDKVFRELKGEAVTMALAAISIVSLPLMIAVSWFFAVPMLASFIGVGIWLRGREEEKSSPSKIIAAIQELPENLRDSVETIAHINTASAAIRDGIISMDEARSFSVLDDFLKRVEFLRSRTCPCCGVTDENRELTNACCFYDRSDLFHDPTLFACRNMVCNNCIVALDTKPVIYMCVSCHMKVAGCIKCRTYYKDRLALYSCAGCDNIFVRSVSRAIICRTQTIVYT